MANDGWGGLVNSGAGGFVPTQLATLGGWWDFSDINTLWKDAGRTNAVTADADTILGVTDKSGAGLHLSTATGPIYNVNIRNGRSVSRYVDAVDDSLASASSLSAGARTLFVVGICTTAGLAGPPSIFGFGGNSNLFDNSGTNWGWRLNQAGGAPTVISLATTAWQTLVVRENSTASADFYGNGGTPTNIDPNDELNNGTVFTLGKNPSGTSGAWDIGEAIFYTSALSNANLNLVGNYLATRWNLTWTTA